MYKLTTFIWNNEKPDFNILKLLAGIIFLIICGLKLTYNFNHQVDISFDDEVKYMRYGLDLFTHIRNDWGPTYNLWYKFLSVFEKQPIELYLLNYKVVIILLPVCLFVFLYVYGISLFSSLWMSFCLLISNTNINTYPRISHVVVSSFLMVLIFNKFFNISKVKQYILLCFVCFLGAYARPELFLSFIIFLSFTVYYIIKKSKIKEWLVFSIPFVAVMFLLYWVFQFPANSYLGKERLYGVFCQHYTVKYIYNHKDDYAIFINWMDFCKKEFAGCNTFVDIVLRYPMVVLLGTLENMKISFLMFFISASDVLYPKYLYYKKTLELLSLLLVFILMGYSLIPKQRRILVRRKLAEHYEVLIILAVFALPGFISAMVFFPRPHYVLFLLIPIILHLAILIDVSLKGLQIKTSIILLVAIVFLIFTPNIKQFSTPHIISGTCPNQHYQSFIRLLNNATNKPHVIFSNILNLSMMTNKNFIDFSAEEHYNNEQTFIAQLNDNHIDYILVTDFLLQDLRLKKDNTWLNFIRHPEKLGFKKIFPFKGCPTYLLYKD